MLKYAIAVLGIEHDELYPQLTVADIGAGEEVDASGDIAYG